MDALTAHGTVGMDSIVSFKIGLDKTPCTTVLKPLHLSPGEIDRRAGVIRYSSSGSDGCVDPGGDNSLPPVTWDSHTGQLMLKTPQTRLHSALENSQSNRQLFLEPMNEFWR